MEVQAVRPLAYYKNHESQSEWLRTYYKNHEKETAGQFVVFVIAGSSDFYRWLVPMVYPAPFRVVTGKPQACQENKYGSILGDPNTRTSAVEGRCLGCGEPPGKCDAI